MWPLLAALALVVLNGFFVAAEFSMVRVRPARLERLQRQGAPGATDALKIAREIERYLSASQIGVTLCSLALGWIGEPAVAELMFRAYRAIVGRDLGPGTAHGIAIGVAFAIVTYVHVLLGEQVPKMLALYRAETIALFISRPFRLAFWLLAPVRFFLERATSGVLSLFGVQMGSHGETKLSEEELLSIIAATMARGPGAEEKRKLMERVIRFASRQARHAMIPRVDVAYLPVGTHGKDGIEYLRRERFSRVILTQGNDLDVVVGYLFSKDLLLDPSAMALPNLKSVRRDVLYVPEAQSLIDALRSMQAEKTLLAVVVDEYGGTSGIVTMEDLLEEIVGDIHDEADDEPVPSVREVQGSPGTFDVEASTPIEELRAHHVEPGDAEDGETLGAYVVRHLGHLPRRGDRVRIGALDVEVRAMRRRRVTALRVLPRAPTVSSLRPATAVGAETNDREERE